jgi:hypothetical protein
MTNPAKYAPATIPNKIQLHFSNPISSQHQVFVLKSPMPHHLPVIISRKQVDTCSG